MSVFTANRRRRWIALAIVGIPACGGGSGNQSKPDARPAAFRDADIYDAPMPSQPLPDCPASCDDQNPCTKDSCAPDTHLCVNDPAAEGTSCIATDLCTLEASCKTGLCVGSKSKDCAAPPDQCHEEGYCVPTTGVCTYPTSTEHKGCDDGNLCTTGDQCIAGVCQAAPIQCGSGTTCDPKTGQCPGFPSATWGFGFDPSAATATNPSFSDLTVSPNGRLYFTCGFANILDLGAGPMSTTTTVKTSASNFDYNAVIARLDPTSGQAMWSMSMGDKANQMGSSIAVNASETVLMSAMFSGKVEIGPALGVDAGSFAFADTGSFPKVFVVAVDGTSGAVAWALPIDISSSNGDTGHAKVAVDPWDGNFVLCASVSKQVTDLGIAHPAGGQGDALIAKFHANTGEVLWAGQYGSPADESCDAVVADGKGKVYVTGHLAQGSTLDFGKGVVRSGPPGKNQQAIYVAQLEGADGTITWAKVFQSQGTTTGQINSKALVADGQSIWIGGSFSYSAVFDQTTLVSFASSPGVDAGSVASKAKTAFVAALDATSGSLLWAQNWGSTAEVTSMALTSTGNLVLGGDYQSGMVFDTGALANPPGSPVPFVAKLTASTGHAQAARGYASSSTSSSWFQAIAVDKTSPGPARDVSYAIGVLGDVSNGLDFGAPVGLVPPQGLKVDAGTFSAAASLFLVKFNP